MPELSRLSRLFLSGLFDGYMYIKYIIIMPFFNYFYPEKVKTESEITHQPCKLPDGTPAFSYVMNDMEFIRLDLNLDILDNNGDFTPIETVLIKATNGTLIDDPILKEAIIKLGGHCGDFNRKKYNLHDILDWFQSERDIERIIATNENYEEFIFKSKED